MIISKENVTSVEDGDVMLGALPGATPSSTGRSSGYTLNPDAKVQTFLNMQAKKLKNFRFRLPAIDAPYILCRWHLP